MTEAPLRRTASLVSRACSRLNRISTGLFALGSVAFSLASSPLLAATAPELGSTTPYAIVSSTFTNTTAGTTIDGDVCYTTAPAVVPFITGATVVPCPAITGTDQNSARAELDSQVCTPIGAAVALNDISIGGGTPGIFPPGCYSSTGAMSITTSTTVTLNGPGVYIFRPGGALDSGADSNVVVAGGACADDVFWAPIGGTTIGANSNFIGNIFRGVADGLSITFGDSSGLSGRALAYGSTVTTANTTFAVPGPCAEPVTITVNKDFIPDSIGTVPVDLTCTSGTVSETPLNASEAQPAVFTVIGADPGTTCTATETVPAGYTANQEDCVGVALGGSCTITNTLNDDTIVVYKDFIPDSLESVSVDLTCTTGTATTTPLDAAEGAPAVFTLTGADPETTCTATETVPAGYTANQEDCVDVPPGGSCEIINSAADSPLPGPARFRVVKDFTDGNPMDVEVTLTCDTGLPLVQSFHISESSTVEFVVTAFEAGAMDCHVTEEPLTGYTAVYTADTVTGIGLVSQDVAGCHFVEVESGRFVCLIVNQPAAVEIGIEKLWLIEGADAGLLNRDFSLRLYCDGQIAPVDIFYGADSATFIADVVPQYPSSHCWVVETVYDSAVEIENNCNDLEISAALGGDSCLITNTVNFEGIPTLSRYGLAILTILMLGIGLVGLRRFG